VQAVARKYFKDEALTVATLDPQPIAALAKASPGPAANPAPGPAR
jgi:hypothetical protein